MPRLAEAEKKLQDAIAALESALLAMPDSPPDSHQDSAQDSPPDSHQASAAASPAPAAPPPDNSAILAEMQNIDRKIEQAMTLVAKAQKNGAAAGEAE